MLDKMTYVNHLGEKISFGEGGIFLNSNDLRKYSWNVTSKNNKIYSIQRAVTNKSAKIVIACDSESEGLNERNRIFEIFDKDVVMSKPGKLLCGDYYLECYVTENAPANYLISNRYMNLSVKITSDSAWIKEITSQYRIDASGSESADLDYPYDYPHDYASGSTETKLNNAAIDSSEFEMIIYGSCANPMVTVGGNVYRIYDTLATGEYFKINSKKRTIVKVKINGTEINVFHKRDKANNIFRQIPTGLSNVTWSGLFGFDLTIYEERSMPVWI